jgi:hypothetical protein
MPERITSNQRVKQELAHAVESKLNQWGIEEIWVDVDETLLRTIPHYHYRMKRALSWLLYNQDHAKIDNSARLEVINGYISFFREQMIDNRAKHCVQPSVMYASLQNIAGKLFQYNYKQTRRFQKAYYEIEQIYEGPCPEPFPGARLNVDIFKMTKRTIRTASHSALRWTKRKISEGQFVGFSGHVCFDTSREKNEQWKEQTNKQGINPKHILVLGDNPQADFALLEYGARGVWINNRQKEIPKEFIPYLETGHLIVVSSTQEVIPAIIGYQ